jgi:hypothetical protein
MFNCKTAQPNGDDHWEQKIQNFPNVVDPPYIEGLVGGMKRENYVNLKKKYM